MLSTPAPQEVVIPHRGMVLSKPTPQAVTTLHREVVLVAISLMAQLPMRQVQTHFSLGQIQEL